MPALDNLKKRVFHHLKVVRRVKNKTYGKKQYAIRWLCKCVCGKTRVVSAGALRDGLTKSCGCQNFTTKHGNMKYDPTEAVYRAKASNYKSHAKRRGIPWRLSVTLATRLLKSRCHYCGATPKNRYQLSRNRRSHLTLRQTGKDVIVLWNGIDRINNNRGYYKNNVVACCTICNQAKRDLSMGKFTAWLNQLATFRRR